jgi:hypothetical protein
MTRIWLLILPTIAAISAAFLFADLQGKGASRLDARATMTESRGTIRRMPKGEPDWEAVVNGAAFADGDAISVGESGSAILMLKSGAKVELSEGSLTIIGPEIPSSPARATTELDLRKRIATSGKPKIDLPSAPSLFSPADGEKISFEKTAEVELKWSKDNLASRYEVTLTPLGHIEGRKVYSPTEPSLRFQAAAEGPYAWTVTAIDASGGRSILSAQRTFDFVHAKAQTQDVSEKNLSVPARLPARVPALPRTSPPIKKAEPITKRRKGPAPKPVLLAPRVNQHRENESPKSTQ